MEFLKLPDITEDDIKNLAIKNQTDKIINKKIESYIKKVYNETYNILAYKGINENNLIESEKKYYMLNKYNKDSSNWLEILLIGMFMFLFVIITFLSVINGFEIQNSWIVLIILILSLTCIYSGIIKLIRKKVTKSMLNSIDIKLKKINKCVKK